MARIEIQLDTSQAKARAAELGADAAPVTQAELEAGILEALLLLEREIKDLSPVGATGAYRAAWTHQVISGESAAEVMGIVSNPLVHAAPVEFGTRPHWPPLEPLVDWVHAKLDIQGSEARRVAEAIRFKIAARGTKAQNVAGRAVEQNIGYIEEILGARVRRIVKHLEKGA